MSESLPEYDRWKGRAPEDEPPAYPRRKHDPDVWIPGEDDYDDYEHEEE